MKQPTKQEIDRLTHAFSSEYKRGFEECVEWLLTWQKSQPLTVYCVMENKQGILDVLKTEESAAQRIEELKTNLPLGKFYIKAKQLTK
jgi:hypothetical protein